MAKIEDLLHRRTDLSTFLVHLTRRSSASTALENLLSIVENMSIEARSPFGPAARLEDNLDTSATQKAVCMTETPLEHIWMMLEDIDGRALQFEPYGLAITKTTGRKAGFNPVWYSDMSRRGHDWPITAVNLMIDDAVSRSRLETGEINREMLNAEAIFKVTPFFEQMGPMRHHLKKEFWWEREWRKIGDYYMSYPSRVVALLAPESDHAQLGAALAEIGTPWSHRPILDPYWGLERMIVALAKVPAEFVGPFPDAE